MLNKYILFIRLHLNYGDILHDKPENENYQNKLEKVQYRAYLAMTGAMRGTSRQKLYDELGLHSLNKRHWRKRRFSLFFFYSYIYRCTA